MALTKITSDGITDGTITGTDLATNIDLVDNQKLRLGTGNDLQIFHNGTHTFIQESGSGALQIRGANLILDNADGSKRYIDCNYLEAYVGYQIEHFDNIVRSVSSQVLYLANKSF